MKMTVTETNDKRTIMINDDSFSNYEVRALLKDVADKLSDDDVAEILLYALTIHPSSESIMNDSADKSEVIILNEEIRA